MTTRALGPGAGWDWLKQAINLGRNNPMAIFGGAALILLVVFAMAIVLSLLVGALMVAIKPGPGGSLAMSLVITIPILLVMAGLMVGYLRVIDAVEHGRPASAAGVFAGFGDFPTSLRAIGFIVVMAVVQNAIVVGLVALLAPDMGSWYLQNMQASMSGQTAQQVPVLPAGFGTALALIWIVSLFGYAVQAIGLGQIALDGRGVGGALGDGVAGAAKNLLPLVVLMLIGIAAAIVLVVLAFLLVMLIGLLAKAIGMWIAFVLGIPLYLIAVVVALVVTFGIMYFMWREICGGAAPSLPQQALPDNQVEL